MQHVGRSVSDLFRGVVCHKTEAGFTWMIPGCYSHTSSAIIPVSNLGLSMAYDNTVLTKVMFETWMWEHSNITGQGTQTI